MLFVLATQLTQVPSAALAGDVFVLDVLAAGYLLS